MTIDSIGCVVELAEISRGSLSLFFCLSLLKLLIISYISFPDKDS